MARRLVARLSANTVLVFGEVDEANNDGPMSLGIVRLVDNVPDTSFGVSGVVRYTPAAGARMIVGAGASDASHNVIMGAISELGAHSVLTRFLPSGILDDTFGVNGVVAFDPPVTAAANVPPGAQALAAQAIAPLAGGKLMVGGKLIEGSGVNRVFLARLNADGSPDPTFVHGGFAFPRIFPDPTNEAYR